MRAELILISVCCLILALVLFFVLGHRELGLFFLGLAVFVRPVGCSACGVERKGGGA
jgi:hypothetical protein